MILGLILGSFLNVVIYRLPLMLQKAWQQEYEEVLRESEHVQAIPDDEKTFDLCFPPSHCPRCQHHLGILENIPVLSYLFLRGQCRSCHQKISWQYPLVEILSAVLGLFCLIKFGLSLLFIAAFLFSLFLLVLAVIDLKHQILPDMMTLPLLWLGLIFSLFQGFTTPTDAIIGACAGYLSLWFVNQVFSLLMGKQGMGYGDFKLLAALGAWMGWQMLPLIILISAGLGALIGGTLILIGAHRREQPIPYGPFLAFAGWICLFFRVDLMHLYSRITGVF